MRHLKKWLAVLLTLTLLLGILPVQMAAALDPVTVDTSTSTGSNAYSYFEYYGSAFAWNSSSAPHHYVGTTNSAETAAYCVQHVKNNPNGRPFADVGDADVFGSKTRAIVKGLTIISQYGYPNGTGGFDDMRARYATAHAIRWWMRYNGADETYRFDDREASPLDIRPKAGEEALFDWATELYELAKAGVEMKHTVKLTPSTIYLDRER